MYVLSQPLHNGQDVTQGQFLCGVQLVWIQNFTGCLNKVKEPSLPYYSLIAWSGENRLIYAFFKVFFPISVK